MANEDLKKMALGRDMTQAGRICGMVSVFLALGGILLMCLWFGLVAGVRGAL